MNLIPQRSSLVVQTASILRDGLKAGTWSASLPGERNLCARLQISRPTLRAALEQLQREGWLKIAQGQPTQILRTASSDSAQSHVVGLVSPLPLHDVPPIVMFWIDELREHLAEAGYQLEIHSGQSWYSQHPQKALAHLTQQTRAGCWVTYLSTEAMQQWFVKSGLPCVVVGSCHEGITLPSVDVDYHAICRHAAGIFLGKGHRQIALVIQDSGRAGDQESEQGFREAFSSGRVGGIIAHHDGTYEGIAAKVDGLLNQKTPPTAFLVARSTPVLTVMGRLMERGRKFPADVALISRDDDAFLNWVVPSVARYANNPKLFADKISRAVVQLAREGSLAQRHVRIMPQFIKGGTLGP